MAKQEDTGRKAQVVYLPHGGGPLPILGDPGHKVMLDFMKVLPSQLRWPSAIIVVSARWEESEATVLGSSYPPMLYDYYGFPEEAYAITYSGPGSPALAGRIVEMVHAAGMPARIDAKRGFDHGHFIPLKMMYPAAEGPSLQLSLLSGLDPAAHIALGRALAPLAREDILVVGSGFSFHNLRTFSWQGTGAADPKNAAFQDWLIETCTTALPQGEREKRLVEWEKAPSARYCHPREEHLLPLHVCFGIARSMSDGPAKKVFDDAILGKRAVGFLW
jgi:aromatic ring-opening dioxygenase catalytic subunit (LigB family)